MSENTKIEWATHTFNPWVGCTKISPACDHCYAEGWAKRSGQVVWGGDRKRTSVANWKLPLKWNKHAELLQVGWAQAVAMHGGDEAACIAAGYIKPVRPKVFCASLADVFDNAVDPVWRDDLFTLIANTQNLDWLLLTKRIGNASTMCPWLPGYTGPDGQRTTNVWRNVWIGATICNQEEADRDIPKLLAVPAHKRFLSMEPLLGPVDLGLLCENWSDDIPMDPETGARECCKACDYTGIGNAIDWVIVGGESGPNARPMHPDWARSLRDQCEAAGGPFLFKQHGEWREPLTGEEYDTSMGRASKPPAFIISHDGAVRCFQDDRFRSTKVVIKVGKKAAGRLLDGREWNGVPV